MKYPDHYLQYAISILERSGFIAAASPSGTSTDTPTQVWRHLDAEVQVSNRLLLSEASLAQIKAQLQSVS